MEHLQCCLDLDLFPKDGYLENIHKSFSIAAEDEPQPSSVMSFIIWLCNVPRPSSYSTSATALSTDCASRGTPLWFESFCMNFTIPRFLYTLKLWQSTQTWARVCSGPRWNNGAIISLDFSTYPPKSSGLRSILVLKCYFSRMAHFIPTNTIVDAVETAELLIQKIFRLHPFTKAIVSDRYSKFTSKCWKHVFRSLHTQFRFSNCLHPETNGQTECLNRTLEIMLTSYVTKYPVLCSLRKRSPNLLDVVISDIVDHSPAESSSSLRTIQDWWTDSRDALPYVQAQYTRFSESARNSREFSHMATWYLWKQILTSLGAQTSPKFPSSCTRWPAQALPDLFKSSKRGRRRKDSRPTSSCPFGTGFSRWADLSTGTLPVSYFMKWKGNRSITGLGKMEQNLWGLIVTLSRTARTPCPNQRSVYWNWWNLIEANWCSTQTVYIMWRFVEFDSVLPLHMQDNWLHVIQRAGKS